MDALGKTLLFSFNFGKIFGIILVFLRIKYNVIFDTFVKCLGSYWTIVSYWLTNYNTVLIVFMTNHRLLTRVTRREAKIAYPVNTKW
jgi:hypothetical protein